MSKKFVLLAVFLIVLGGVGFVLYQVLYMQKPVSLSSILKGLESPAPEKSVSPTPQIKAEMTLWEIFQEFLAANKVHDLEKLKKVSYKAEMEDAFAYCKGSERPIGSSDEECISMLWEMAGSMAASWEDAKEADFVNVKKNEQQAIMDTDPIKNGDQGYNIKSLYFIRDPEGNMVVLYVSNKNLYYKESEIAEIVKDSDGDGIFDKDESCKFSFCVKTDPQKKDTDEDGWWDGIEIQAETDPLSSKDYPFMAK